MTIRKATEQDFDALYALGKNTPELQVSASEVFMDEDEFRWAINNKEGIFLVAEVEGIIAGFIYANLADLDRSNIHKWACLVYLAVSPEYRKQGVAQELYKRLEQEVKALGVSHLYGWANAEKDGIIHFMEKQGFAKGHQYLWMDKKI